MVAGVGNMASNKICIFGFMETCFFQSDVRLENILFHFLSLIYNRHFIRVNFETEGIQLQNVFNVAIESF